MLHYYIDSDYCGNVYIGAIYTKQMKKDKKDLTMQQPKKMPLAPSDPLKVKFMLQYVGTDQLDGYHNYPYIPQAQPTNPHLLAPQYIYHLTCYSYHRLNTNNR